MKRLLPYGVAVVVFALLTGHLMVHGAVVGEIHWTARPHLLIAHLGLLVLAFTGFAAGWHLALRACGGNLGWRQAAAIYLTANLGKYIPGKLFMLAGRVEMARAFGVRRPVSLTALTIEHIAQLLGALPFLVGGILHGIRVTNTAAAAALGAAIVGAAALVVRPGLFIGLVNRCLRRWGRGPVAGSPGATDMLMLLGLFGVSWLCYGLSGVCLVRAMVPSAGVPAAAIATAFVSAWLIGFVTLITPGGLGVREAVLLAALAGRMPSAQAAALALVARLTWTAVEMVGVGIGALLTGMGAEGDAGR